MKRPATHTLTRRRASMCTEAEGGRSEHLLYILQWEFYANAYSLTFTFKPTFLI
jgi:hypothetical protein